MDYEKKYREALEKTRSYHKRLLEDDNPEWACELETIFPELKESEDERVRKVLIELVKCNERSGYKLLNNVPTSSMIAWLEKQKANTTHADWNDYKDKPVEVWNAYVRGLNIGMERGKKVVIKSPEIYGLEKQDEQKLDGTFVNVDDVRENFVNEVYRVLDADPNNDRANQIIDAFDNLPTVAIEKQGEQKPTNVIPKFKVGDWIIYMGTIAKILDLHIHYYVGENVNGDDFAVAYSNAHLMRKWTIQDAKDGDVLAVDNIIFIYERTLASHIVSYCKLINDVFESSFDARTCCEGNSYVHPATKEQCDLLFSKMKEAGYKWDADKKELKKVEQKPAEWSEEDEKEYKFALSFSKDAYESCHNQKEYDEGKRVYNWLKSLRPQKQLESKYQNWTARDEEELKIATDILREAGQHDSAKWVENLATFPLRNQKQWKPSDKQIEALDFAADCIVPAEFNFKRKELKGLLEQLKKL